MKTKISLKYFVSYCSPVNSGSVLTGRIHTKIMRLGDGCLNRETPNKSGRLGAGMLKSFWIYLLQLKCDCLGKSMEFNWGNPNASEVSFSVIHTAKNHHDADLSCELSVSIISVMFSISQLPLLKPA